MDFSLGKITNINTSLSATGTKLQLLNTKTNIEERMISHLERSRQITNSKNIELVFIFDKSGSCEGTEQATLQGFDYLVQDEKNNGYDTVVTTVLFDEKEKIIHDRLPINQISPFSYKAFGGTALYDTLYSTLDRVMKGQITDIDAPRRTVVVIMTDGLDVSSSSYTIHDAKKIIKECYEMGFEFILLGTGIDAKDLARSLKIKTEYAENYSTSNNGIKLNFDAIKKILSGIRYNGQIAEDWSKDIRDNLTLPYNNNQKIKKLGGKNG